MEHDSAGFVAVEGPSVVLQWAPGAGGGLPSAAGGYALHAPAGAAPLQQTGSHSGFLQLASAPGANQHVYVLVQQPENCLGGAAPGTTNTTQHVFFPTDQEMQVLQLQQVPDHGHEQAQGMGHHHFILQPAGLDQQVVQVVELDTQQQQQQQDQQDQQLQQQQQQQQDHQHQQLQQLQHLMPALAAKRTRSGVLLPPDGAPYHPHPHHAQHPTVPSSDSHNSSEDVHPQHASPPGGKLQQQRTQPQQAAPPQLPAQHPARATAPAGSTWQQEARPQPPQQQRKGPQPRLSQGQGQVGASLLKSAATAPHLALPEAAALAALPSSMSLGPAGSLPANLEQIDFKTLYPARTATGRRKCTTERNRDKAAGMQLLVDSMNHMAQGLVRQNTLAGVRLRLLEAMTQIRDDQLALLGQAQRLTEQLKGAGRSGVEEGDAPDGGSSLVVDGVSLTAQEVDVITQMSGADVLNLVRSSTLEAAKDLQALTSAGIAVAAPLGSPDGGSSGGGSSTPRLQELLRLVMEVDDSGQGLLQAGGRQAHSMSQLDTALAQLEASGATLSAQEQALHRLTNNVSRNLGTVLRAVATLNPPCFVSLLPLNLERGEPGQPPASHWQEALQHMHLSPTQNLELLVAARLHSEVCHKLHQEAVKLVEDMCAGEERSAGEEAGDGASPLKGAPGAPVGSLRQLEVLLQLGHLRTRQQNAYITLHHLVFGRVLTPLQVATCTVHSWPYMPDAVVLASLVKLQHATVTVAPGPAA